MRFKVEVRKGFEDHVIYKTFDSAEEFTLVDTPYVAFEKVVNEANLEVFKKYHSWKEIPEEIIANGLVLYPDAKNKLFILDDNSRKKNIKLMTLYTSAIVPVKR